MGDNSGPLTPGERISNELAYKGQLNVPKETVDRLTKGIKGALDELREIGTDVDAAQGSGFEEMSLTKMEVGDDALSQSFEGFCERWEWGVRGLLADADGIAEGLGLAAGMTWEEDRYRSRAIKGSVNALNPFGNPYASKEGLDKAGYGDLATGQVEGKPGQSGGQQPGGGAGRPGQGGEGGVG
ncbi:hypothetical protein [Streptomyces sp. 891-h]|uniref:hypothetical protein n=1 Tax=unclassified Streptomyces TaxID=2593676 RepID=UPI001FA9E538|nr:hypothetical protein [Streptomyces sp. 891-h]UNZ19126.1 hypothetical protein HC362_20825 [Streptomyces sp. 891-h]